MPSFSVTPSELRELADELEDLGGNSSTERKLRELVNDAESLSSQISGLLTTDLEDLESAVRDLASEADALEGSLRDLADEVE